MIQRRAFIALGIVALLVGADLVTVRVILP